MQNVLDKFAPTVTRPVTNPARPDLPPLVAYNGVSMWVKTSEDKQPVFNTLRHPIGKTGAGLNAAIDRILRSFEARQGKGFGDLEGYDFVMLGVEPIPDQS